MTKFEQLFNEATKLMTENGITETELIFYPDLSVVKKVKAIYKEMASIPTDTFTTRDWELYRCLG